MAQIKKFLTSVADAFFYSEDNVLIFTSKTLINSDLEVTLGSSVVTGGRGNVQQFIYYHTGQLNVTLNDSQFNLQMLGSTVGSEVVTGNNVYTEETITLTTSGAGTVLGTPLAVSGSTIYGWVTQVGGTIERVTFSGSTFASSSGASGSVVCVRYFAADAASRSITIPANALPKIGRLVLEAQLNSSDETSNKIGVIQIIIPKATLSGAFTLTMASDGVSQTPLTASALASTDLTVASCQNEPVYAQIIEVLDNANWYDGVTALAIEGGNFAITAATSPKTLVVYAIRPGDAPFIAPNADLDFTSGTVGTVTAGLHTGIITFVGAGSSLISVAISAATSIEAQATCSAS